LAQERSGARSRASRARRPRARRSRAPPSRRPPVSLLSAMALGRAGTVGRVASMSAVTAEQVEVQDVQALIRERFKKGAEGPRFVQTLLAVVDILTEGVGGCIFLVMKSNLLKKIKYHYLDDGIHTECLKHVAPNIHNHSEAFKIFVEMFSGHNSTDKWEHQELVDLVRQLPDTAEFVGKLLGQPKDGAIVIGHGGEVMGCCAFLKHPSYRLQMIKHDGTSVGTRHSSSLGMAEFLGGYDRSGVVFVRSDSGGAHAFVPEAEIPRVLHFPTLEIPDQEKMLSIFRELIMKNGTLMRRTRPALIRPARCGEQVVTLIDGTPTSHFTRIEDNDKMVVMQITVDKELMVMGKEKVASMYEMPGADLETLNDSQFLNKYFLERHATKLKKRGYRLCFLKRDQVRWFYSMTEADIARVPTKSFVSPVGSTLAVRPGDYLVMPSPEEKATEIYVLNSDALDSYVDANSSNEESLRFLSQLEMVKLFEDVILEEGSLMTKAMPAPIRLAIKGERIVTCVNGRVTSKIVVSDDTSYVVRGVQGELYVLTLDRMKANYELAGTPLKIQTAMDKLLVSQGFKQHMPMQNKKWIYKVKASDVEQLKNGFQTSWGVVQIPKLGDYIVMTTGKRELYLLPEEGYSEFSPVEPMITL